MSRVPISVPDATSVSWPVEGYTKLITASRIPRIPYPLINGYFSYRLAVDKDRNEDNAALAEGW